MTYEKAIEYWNVFCNERIEYEKKYGVLYDDWDEQRDAIIVSIDALERQIPQLVDTDFLPYNNTEDSIEVGVCPECAECLDPEWDYCPSCGQRIRWE